MPPTAHTQRQKQRPSNVLSLADLVVVKTRKRQPQPRSQDKVAEKSTAHHKREHEAKGVHATAISPEVYRVFKHKKKRLSTLKKKILLERMQRSMREAAQTEPTPKQEDPDAFRFVQIDGFVDVGGSYDEEEFLEILNNLTDIASPFSGFCCVNIPRSPNGTAEGPVFAEFENQQFAEIACASISGLVFGGQTIRARICGHTTIPPSQVQLFHLEIEDVLEDDEVELPEQRAEIISDFIALCNGHGTPLDVVIENRKSKSHEQLLLVLCPQTELADECTVVFVFDSHDSAVLFSTHMDGKVFGGTRVCACYNLDQSQEALSSSPYRVHVYGLFQQSDLCDEAERKEIESNVDELLTGQTFSSIELITDKSLLVVYCNDEVGAQGVVKALNGLIVSEVALSAEYTCSDVASTISKCHVYIWGLVSSDDIIEEDQRAEVLTDLRQLASEFGNCGCVHVLSSTGDDIIEAQCQSREIVLRMAFATRLERDRVRDVLDGIKMGGSNIKAKTVQESDTEPASVEDAPAVMGATISPEKNLSASTSKYTLAKDAPRLPKRSEPLYRLPVASSEIDDIVKGMLHDLAHFQARARERNAVKAKKRIVLGLREVARGVRAGNIKLVLLAPDTECGESIDDKTESLVKTAYEKNVPVLYCLSRRRMGKAIGSSMRVSVVGVYGVDGVHEAFTKIKRFVQQNASDDPWNTNTTSIEAIETEVDDSKVDEG